MISSPLLTETFGDGTDEWMDRLLLIHGLIDENVHFRHTSRLINALIRAKKVYHLLLFPSERHSPHKLQDRIFMGDEITRFFVENIPPGSPADAILASDVSVHVPVSSSPVSSPAKVISKI